MSTPPPRERFAAVVAAGDQCDLARGALEIARIAYPALAPEPYLRQLDALAADVRPRLAGRGAVAGRGACENAVRELTSHLFERCGFHGNTENYYDPRNSFLDQVLERKLGIPISLSLLYIEVGRRIGLTLHGVSFPGHFLVKCTLEDGIVVLDPYCGGISLRLQDLQQRLREAVGAERGAHQRQVVAAGELRRMHREHRQDQEQPQHAQAEDARQAQRRSQLVRTHPIRARH